MKKITRTATIILCAVTLFGCGTKITDPQITATVSVAVALTFRYVPMESAKRTTIANYVSAIAGKARTFTGAETQEQVAAALAAQVPPNVLAEFPEIGTTVIPLVASYYQAAKDQFGPNTKEFLSRMNAVAAGIEQGVSPYIGH